MTVFDRLEAQLLDAHAHRNRRPLPRPAPRHVVAFAAAAAAVVAIIVAGLAGGPASRTAQRPGDGQVVPAHTTVAVLNAAHQPGRARDVAYALARRGWRIVRVTNHPGAPAAISSVHFAPGRSEAASMVAAELGIHDVTASPKAAVPTAPWSGAQVVVVVGLDQIRQLR